MKLGDKVKDEITGLEGIAVGRSERLDQGPTICVQPCGMNQGSPIPEVWLSEKRLKVIESTMSGHYV